MNSNQRNKEWWYYYWSSDKSRSRRVHSSTSRWQPSSTSSDLDTRLSFIPVRQAAAAFDIVYLATMARLFVWESVWRSTYLIWSTFFLCRRRLCVVATPAFAGRPLETGPKFEAYKGLAPSLKFSNPCRSAPAWESPHPSRTMLAIFQAAVAPAAAMSPSTPSAESFAVTCGWRV